MPSTGVRAAIVVLGSMITFSGLAATPEQVDKAIKKGVAWLYSKQNEKGNWEVVEKRSPDYRKELSKVEGGQFGGLTAIATYALLDSGESWKDPRIKDSVEWLNKASMTGVYAVALRAQIWQYLPQNQMVKQAAQRDCNMLLAGMKGGKTEARGFWSYLIDDGTASRYDHSTSQIAVLGIWACQQAGREVPLAFWKETELAWQRHQYEDGSWSYVYKAQNEHGNPKMTMTLAGVATLFITQDYVHLTDGLACKGNIFDDRLVKGTRWIHDHFNEGLGAGYSVYAMERVAVASGYRYFGDIDWYKQGAESVVRRQAADGSWGGSVPETAFSLIFLSRGRNPLIMTKLDYDFTGTPPKTNRPAPKGPQVLPEAEQPPADGEAAVKTYPGNWCQRPRDVAMFARWMSDVTERKLNWQVLGPKANIDDFHDAPVVYMAGNQKLDNLSPEVMSKLKQYIEEGGLVLGHADCGSKEFTDSFIELGTKLFPTYEFRELPAEHPIYTNQQYQRRNWKNPPSVMAMTNGTRELMVILPNTDIARWWQQNTYNGKEESFQIANSIILYAVDRQNLKYKGAVHTVRAKTEEGGEELARKLKVARLQWAGNWDPEPAGWRRLAAILQNQKQLKLIPETVKLGEGKLDAAVYPIAHLTGTGGFTFTKEQLNELKKYAIKGGVVICDAAGGETGFSEAAQRELAQIIAGAKFEAIAPNDKLLAAITGTGAVLDPMLAPAPASKKIFEQPSTTQATTQATTQSATQPAGAKALVEAATQPATTQAAEPETAKVTLPGGFEVHYRKFARSRVGSSDALRLKGIKFRNKYAVIFSGEDLSTGMVGHQVDGIHGYTPATATEIMRRLLVNLAPPAPSGDQPAQ